MGGMKRVLTEKYHNLNLEEVRSLETQNEPTLIGEPNLLKRARIPITILLASFKADLLFTQLPLDLDQILEQTQDTSDRL